MVPPRDPLFPPRSGVTLAEGGAWFAVRSGEAERLEVCLFEGDREIARHVLTDRLGDLRFGFVAGVGPGDRYGLRAHGPWRPLEGLRFNPAKLLVDPYATRLDTPPSATGLFAPTAGGDDDLELDARDTACLVPKAIIERRAEAVPRRPRPRPGARLVYEAHPRGLTRFLEAVPEANRGTLAAIAHPAVLDHLVGLGVTTLELMPIMARLDERHLPALGLTNAWGYNTLAFMAPDPRLAPGGMAEVVALVEACHAAGIEVILDIVLNHTAESDERGATISLRGLDNRAYYRLRDGGRFYVNDTGCGHTLALDRPAGLSLALDALRHWAGVAGVDGFRFDLGTVLGRSDHGFSEDAPLLAAIADDPLLSDRLMIVEPWDVGPGGYRLGGFPARMAEWNDRYRDDVRRFWRGDGSVGSLATRLAGSSDVFAARHRPPAVSLNFVSAHDGFTLADLVRFAGKMNDANGENNRDGHDGEVSWTGGGRDDEKALLATLLLSAGTPMLGMGTELGRTQHGNNNAYAQDNHLNAIDWAGADHDLIAFVRRAVALRRSLPAFQAARHWTPDDVTWLAPDGEPMGEADWHGDGRCLGLLAGDGDGRFVAWFNGGGALAVTASFAGAGRRWRLALATHGDAAGDIASFAGTTLPPRSVTVWLGAAAPAGSGAADDALVARLAVAAGIAPDWWEVSGKHTVVALGTKRALLTALGLPWRTRREAEESLARLETPETRAGPGEARAYLPRALAEGGRGFGIAAQLYALRRADDQGIGDFTTLRTLAGRAAAAGAATVGLNPFHARFASAPERVSPYQPSDRRFLDWTMVDLAGLPAAEAVPDLLERDGAAIGAVRSARHVDHAFVSRLKREALLVAHARFRERAPPERRAAFAAFRAAGGEALARFALFEAIEMEAGAPPKDLPARVPPALETAVEAALYRQFEADRQLGEAAVPGLSIGLFRDLAVGPARDGAEVVAEPGLFMTGVTIGAPPDPFSASGQNWALPPLNPLAPDGRFIAHVRALVAANMRHAGALRIDHVMALTRLFLIPDGASPSEGAYLAYPREALLSAIASASREARCLVVGEDLGTVPDGFRERLAAADLLSYRVLFFERDGVAVRPPQLWPAKAIACVSTHDLPPLAGWWAGDDIALDRGLGRAVAPDAEVLRAAERGGLLAAIGDRGDGMLTPERLAAIHGLVAASPAMIAFAQAEECAGERTPVNVPGTDREYRNWSRRLQVEADDLLETPAARAILAAFRAR